jgi:hypothetical protein
MANNEKNNMFSGEEACKTRIGLQIAGLLEK